jgi:hypothetical protein
MVPFVAGGAEACATGLQQALLAHGHAVEIVAIPFKWYPPDEIVRQMLIWELLDLTEANGKTIDKVIALKFPAYLLKHPNKVVWLVHQHRQAYDLWGTQYGDLEGPEGSRVREIITRADNRALREPSEVFTISRNVSERLLKYNLIPSTPLYPPGRSTRALLLRRFWRLYLLSEPAGCAQAPGPSHRSDVTGEIGRKVCVRRTRRPRARASQPHR